MVYALNRFSYPQIMLLSLLYLALAGAYLLAIPLIVMFYLNWRWYSATSVERGFMYFLVFFLLPRFVVAFPHCQFFDPDPDKLFNVIGRSQLSCDVLMQLLLP